MSSLWSFPPIQLYNELFNLTHCGLYIVTVFNIPLDLSSTAYEVEYVEIKFLMESKLSLLFFPFLFLHSFPSFPQ